MYNRALTQFNKGVPLPCPSRGLPSGSIKLLRHCTAPLVGLAKDQEIFVFFHVVGEAAFHAAFHEANIPHFTYAGFTAFRGQQERAIIAACAGIEWVGPCCWYPTRLETDTDVRERMRERDLHLMDAAWPFQGVMHLS